jgi:hypothetical protein
MQSNYEKIKTFFMQRFPEANEKILQIVANNRLKGLGIKQDLENPDDSTTQELITFFSTLSPLELEDLTFNALKA